VKAPGLQIPSARDEVIEGSFGSGGRTGVHTDSHWGSFRLVEAASGVLSCLPAPATNLPSGRRENPKDGIMMADVNQQQYSRWLPNKTHIQLIEVEIGSIRDQQRKM
jgi:hypothetical protein